MKNRKKVILLSMKDQIIYDTNQLFKHIKLTYVMSEQQK